MQEQNETNVTVPTYKYAILAYNEGDITNEEILDVFDTEIEALREVFEMMRADIGDGRCDYFDIPDEVASATGVLPNVWIAQDAHNGKVHWNTWGYEVTMIRM
jgi:hypothetical protein